MQPFCLTPWFINPYHFVIRSLIISFLKVDDIEVFLIEIPSTKTKRVDYNCPYVDLFLIYYVFYNINFFGCLTNA